MSDIRRPNHDKPSLWGSFKKRLSSRLKNGDGGVGNRPQLQDLSTRGEPQSSATRRKSQRTNQDSGPRTCFKLGQNSNGGRPVFLCPSSQQRFTPLDDDTFSTKPLIGIASRYNQHYSEVWLADYIDATKRKAQSGREESAQDPASNETAAERTGGGRKTTKSSGVVIATGQSALGEETDRLANALSKASIVDSSSGCRGHFESQCSYDESSTSHTSSLNPSEFSFEADFSQIKDDIGHGEFSSNKNYRMTNHYSEVMLTGFPDGESRMVAVRHVDRTSTDKSTLRPTDKSIVPLQICPRADVQQYKVQYQGETQRANKSIASDKGIHQVGKVFRPILAESGYQGELMRHEEANLVSSTGASDGYHHDPALINSIFRTSGNSDVEKPVVREAEKQSIPTERYPDEAKPRGSDDFDLVLKNGVRSDGSDLSNFLSDITETTTSGGERLSHTGTREEEKTLQADLKEHAYRKTKCVVVYNRLLSEAQKASDDGTPANVRDIVVRLEALKRLESDAEKFGYKDFLPINEQRKRENIERVISESFSYEGGSQRLDL